MPSDQYMTIEHAQTLLAEVDLQLLKKVMISNYEGPSGPIGVQLRYGSQSIICHKGSYGADEELFEICPTAQGKSLHELYRRSDVIGWLELTQAMSIAVAAEHHPESLETVLRSIDGAKSVRDTMEEIALGRLLF